MSAAHNHAAKGAPSGAPAARPQLVKGQPVWAYNRRGTVQAAGAGIVVVRFADRGQGTQAVPVRAVSTVDGLVRLSRARSTGTEVGLYRAAEAGLDPEGGPWATVCEAHSAVVNHATRRDAQGWMSQPEGWCEDCRDALATGPADEADLADTAWCPLDGDQLVTGYGTTRGPDPYAIDQLACGHHVVAYGPDHADVQIIFGPKGPGRQAPLLDEDSSEYGQPGTGRWGQ